MNLFFILISICIIGLLYLLYLLVFSRKPNSRAHIPKILSKNNMCLFFSSLENDISYRRRRNITRVLEKYRINFKMLPGVQNIPQIEIRYFYLLNMLNSFKKSDYEYAIICDDDFIPCSNFWNELTKTVSMIDKDFRALHLCPGFLWGRKFRDTSKISNLNPEDDISDIPFTHERYFSNVDFKQFVEKKIWLGGPMAFLINKKYIDWFIHDYNTYYESFKYPNDVILTFMLNSKDYICRQPQLGYEKEEGGSVFMTEN